MNDSEYILIHRYLCRGNSRYRTEELNLSFDSVYVYTTITSTLAFCEPMTLSEIILWDVLKSFVNRERHIKVSCRMRGLGSGQIYICSQKVCNIQVWHANGPVLSQTMLIQPQALLTTSLV